MIVEMICLFLMQYISIQSFENLFDENLIEFENELPKDIFWAILNTNFEKKESVISLKTILGKYIKNSCYDVYSQVNDAYVDRIIESNRNDNVAKLLRITSARKEEIRIDCSYIKTKEKLIYELKKALITDGNCGDNWNAINDFIYDIAWPEHLIFEGWDNIERTLPQDALILSFILKKINKNECIIEFD